jgi:hypothetical protein
MPAWCASGAATTRTDRARLPQDAAQEVSVGAVQQAVTKGVASIHDVKFANAAAADALETKVRATSLLTGVGTGTKVVHFQA